MYFICFTNLNALNAVYNSDKRQNKKRRKNVKRTFSKRDIFEIHTGSTSTTNEGTSVLTQTNEQMTD